MSNLVVNKLSEFLSKIIKNYSKDVLNVSLLKGEVDLKDFEVDVNVINIYVEHYMPFVHVTKASISDVKLALPDVFHLSSKPTIIQIGHVEIECIQRDFSKPPAITLVEDPEFFLTASSTADDKDNYGLIKKVIDGCRVEIDCIHLKFSLNGLPATNDKIGPKFNANWFGKNVDISKYSGKPLILDVLLQSCVFQQTNQKWELNNDLKYLRKSQGDRTKDFSVYKIFTSKSFNVTLMPHPIRIKKNKKKTKKPKKNHDAVFLLQNAKLDLKFIFQRKASDGTLKTISIECGFKKLDIFMTQRQYFDLNYWIACFLYAQAQQYAFDNPHLTVKDDNDNELSQSYSITAQSISNKNIKTDENKQEHKHDNKEDDEDITAKESHHLSAGKLLFDALSLCQPPRFQWNKIPIYTTVGVRIGRFSVHIMPSNWTYNQQTKSHRKTSKTYSKQSQRPQPIGRQRSSSQTLIKGVRGMSKNVKDIGSIGVKGIGTMAKVTAKGVGSIGKGMKKVVHKPKKKPTTKPPPPPTSKPPSKPPSKPMTTNQKRVHNTRKSFTRKTDEMHNHKYAQRHGPLTESRIGDIDKEFLIECHLMPKQPINKISVGDEFNYEPYIIQNKMYCKPLVMAILSDFSLGMIFPDMGYSIWRTRIGKTRVEQFFSVQIGDLDVLADTQLKEQLQDQLKTGFDAAVSQLRKEQEIIDKEKEKEFTPELNSDKGSNNTEDESPSKSDQLPNKSDKSDKSEPDSTTMRGRSKSDPDVLNQNKNETQKKTKCMTLIVSSRHYKTHNIRADRGFQFTVSTPFKGYTADTMSVFNYQWTRRIPSPSHILSQMIDMHCKPICIYLDPFLVFNCVKLFAGNGVIRVYRMGAALTTFTVIFERFVSRYLIDAVQIIIPINPTSRVSASIHNLRLCSHDKLDQTVHERGLVDLSNFSSVGKHSLHAMGLGKPIINKIQQTKEEYYAKLRENEYNGGHFSASYDNRLKASIAPNVSSIVRAPDEYPWEINIGHFSLASVVELQDIRYDNEIQILNCRMRYVMIRSEYDDIDSHSIENNIKPFIETQLSFRTDSVEGSIDTTVLDQVLNKIDFGGIADLPLPALFNKIKSKMKQKQQRQEMERKLKKERLLNNNIKSEEIDDEEMEKEEKRLRKQQKKRQKLLKKSKSKLGNDLIEKDVLLNNNNNSKHSDVREIDLSDSDNNNNKNENNNNNNSNVLDLDSFIEGVLDNIGGNDDNDMDNDDENDINNTGPSSPIPSNKLLLSTGSLINSDIESESESISISSKKRREKLKQREKDEIEYRLIIFSNLDRGEFQITNNGITQLKGKTRSQQLLLQWTSDVLNFHFFSTELKLYESPIGKYQEHDVVTRFSRSKDGRMWSEVVHDEPDGAIELTYPPSLQRIVDKINDNKEEKEKEKGKDKEKEKDKDRDNRELLDLVKYITSENRVMQTRILQLASDLSVSRDDMKRFVKQTSEDKIRIVEHQQYLINDNMELQKQVQSYKKRIRELELARNYVKKK